MRSVRRFCLRAEFQWAKERHAVRPIAHENSIVSETSIQLRKSEVESMQVKTPEWERTAGVDGHSRRVALKKQDF